MTKILFLLTGLFSFCFAHAQSQADSFTSVKIIKDPRLDLLIKKQAELNKEVYLQNSRTGLGFRVLVVNTNDRNKAIDIKTKLLRDFPEHKTYFFYQSPYYKVQIGNFKEIKDAEALQKKVSRIYPEGVVVVPSVVELKPEPEETVN
jgi:hypothetical protein